MTNFLRDAERQLDEADDRAKLLGDRLAFVSDWECRVRRDPLDDPDRHARLSVLRCRRRDILAELAIVFATTGDLETVRDQALAGEID